MNPSEASAGRVEALHAGQKLARFFEELLGEGGYYGPVAVAGGYLRDVALCRTPKDLDLFLDGGKITDMDGAERLAATLANRLIGASVGRSIPCYGEWAEDVACVVPVKLDLSRPPLDLWPKGCMIPQDVDLVILIRDRMVEHGYTARLTNDAYNQELFLKAVVARVDLRLNALGSTPAFTHASPLWDMDAFNSRLVIQKTRGDGSARIVKRLERLLLDKYRGWTTYCEQEDGSLAPFPVGSQPAGGDSEE
jgi:hypothetical protein